MVPMMLLASMSWTQKECFCLVKEAVDVEEKSSCCSAANAASCEAPEEKPAEHDVELCTDKSCCVQVTVVVEQSITELISSATYHVEAPVVASIDHGHLEMEAFDFRDKASSLLECSKPPDRGKSICIWISCFRC